MTMNDTTILIIAVAVVVALLAVILLARSSRSSGTLVEPPSELSPIAPDVPLPDPTAAPGLSPTELAPAPEPLPSGPPQDLTRLKGLGPKAAALLDGMGVTRYEQIAAWNDADVARIDAHMGAFRGRIARDRWVEQARLLADEDIAGFEARFGKLG